VGARTTWRKGGRKRGREEGMKGSSIEVAEERRDGVTKVGWG
jgi:hypothetical protein